ncbi:hypothetical protein SAMN05421811_110219 [Nonomuraea wenchangensis]|uniref:Uncharacterized protein n=1 Tax=Nonomuraea wenchangensis TaxID=568860 RepID=A0A1I0KXH0_9ACTN|nr:hypothetical protein SAMN05421811_110219 [Nonomuraea wenchangensis]
MRVSRSVNTSLRTLLAGGAAAVALVAAGGAAQAATAAYPRYKAPKIFGTTFQPDPKHDFTKRISPRHDGILRGWITHVSGGVAEYQPIKWKRDKHTEGYFVGPGEGDATAYASPIAKNVEFLSAYGCKQAGGSLTVSRSTGLGAKRCPASVLVKRHGKQRQPALITVYRGKIVKVQEIYVP